MVNKEDIIIKLNFLMYWCIKTSCSKLIITLYTWQW